MKPCCLFVVVIWVISLLNLMLVASENMDSAKCLQQCQLKVKDKDETFQKFLELYSQKPKRVIYFHLRNHGQKLLRGNARNVVYAFIKKDVGQTIFSLSTTYMSLSLGLPSVFTADLELDFNQSRPGCFKSVSAACKDHIIMRALIVFVKLPQRCIISQHQHGLVCGTICRRNYTSEIGTNPYQVNYACCDQDQVQFKINTTQCLTQQHDTEWYIHVMRVLSIFLSIPISVAFMIKCINIYMSSLGKVTIDEGRKIRILTPLQFHAIGYFYLRTSITKRSWKQLRYGCMFILTAVFALAGSFLSIIFQVYPTYFQFQPRISDLFMPRSVLMHISAVSSVYAFLTLIMLLPCIKGCCNASSPNDDDITLQLSFRCYTNNTHRQLHFQYKNLIADIKIYWNSGNLIGLIYGCFSILICTPFVILARIEIIRITLYFADILALRLIYNLLPVKSRETLLCRIATSLLSLIAFLYSLLSVVGIWLFLQLVARIILTFASFLVANSVHFIVVVIIIVPYLLYVHRTIQAYRNKEHILPMRILRLKETINQEIGNIWNARNGTLIVYFKSSYDGKCFVLDVPEMLNNDAIKLKIRQYLQEIVDVRCGPLTEGISKIIFHYEKQPDDTVKVSLPLFNQNYLSYKYNKRLTSLTDQIGKHLQEITKQQFNDNLVPIFYTIDDIDDFDCTGMSYELFHYLRYYAPQVSLNLWRIFFNVGITSGIYLTFILTLLLDSNIPTLFTLNSAVANLPLLATASAVSFKYLTISEVDPNIANKIILTNIVQYRRGYKFFCTRGIEFRPIIQLKKILFSPRPRQSADVENQTQESEMTFVEFK